MRTGLSRRAFLGGTAAVGATAFGAAAVVANADTGQPGAARPEFRGEHQSGVLAAPDKAGLLVAFHCVDTDRAGLTDTVKALSGEIESLMAAAPTQQLTKASPPVDNGVLDDVDHPQVTATLSVGSSLFDKRYGLAGVKPRELVPMTRLANDRLDPDRTHGDLLLLLHAEHPDVCVHALRRIMRRTRAGLVLKWTVDGFNRPDAKPVAGRTNTRNLLGFKDGTANPDAGDAALMDDLIWTRAGDGEPAWATGGTYQAVRIIRMFVEQWDRATLGEQESIIGRQKSSGAPLDGRAETDTPGFASNPHDAGTPADAHIRLANPHTAASTATRIVRRGFSYSRGFDGAGLLDQGLAFLSYQKRLTHFLDIQARLKGEALEEYTEPQGGGFFYALPGAPRSGGYLGQPLLES